MADRMPLGYYLGKIKPSQTMIFNLSLGMCFIYFQMDL